MAPPSRQAGPGLYDPTYEHDACGVAFVARLGAPASHEVIARALWALEHLEHRGAEGADADTGDGAGILIQLPDAFLRDEVPLRAARAGPLRRRPSASCPSDEFAREHAERLIDETVEAEGQHVLGWRDVPVDPAALRHRRRAPSRRASASCSSAPPTTSRTRTRSSASLYVIRRVVERAELPDLAIAELVEQDGRLQGDAHRPAAVAVLPRPAATSGSSAALALVHSRFSTNTFPSWELAHPYRMLAHNGEINTLRGNRNWHARPRAARSPRRCSATTSTRSAGCCATTSPTRPRSTA